MRKISRISAYFAFAGVVGFGSVASAGYATYVSTVKSVRVYDSGFLKIELDNVTFACNATTHPTAAVDGTSAAAEEFTRMATAAFLSGTPLSVTIYDNTEQGANCKIRMLKVQ